MNMLLTVGVVLAGYLIGSISFARLVGRRVAPGEDLTTTQVKVEGASRDFEIKTVSATAMLMRGGPRAGCTVSILDMIKAAGPMLLLWWLYPERPGLQVLMALAVVIGHNYPIYHQFKGGRGLSPIMGSLLVIDPLSLPVTIILSNVLGIAILREYLVAYTSWLFMLIPWLWWRTDSWIYPAYAAAVAALFFFSMRPEIAMYLDFKRTKDFDDSKPFLERIQQTEFGRPIKYIQQYGLLDFMAGKENAPDPGDASSKQKDDS